VVVSLAAVASPNPAAFSAAVGQALAGPAFAAAVAAALPAASLDLGSVALVAASRRSRQRPTAKGARYVCPAGSAIYGCRCNVTQHSPNLASALVF